MKKGLLLTIFFLRLISWSSGVQIPDKNFVDFLKLFYPQTINTEGNLIPEEAQKIKGALFLINHKISTLEGIQYFENIERLYASDNPIETIPQLSELKNLISVDLSDTRLIKLPPIDSLVHLKQLSIHDNELKSLPSFAHLNKLEKLVAYNNQLERLPQFSSQNILHHLDLSNNPIHIEEEIYKYPHLQNLILSDIGLNHFVSLNPLTELIRVNFSSNNFSEIPEINELNNLEEIDLSNNHINVITEGLLHLPSLKQAKIDRNNFTLQQLLKLKNTPNFEEIFIIMPQNPFYHQAIYDLKTNQSLSLSTSIDMKLANIHYKLFKDEELIMSNNDGTFFFQNLTKDFSGTYHIRVYSDELSNIYRNSNDFVVEIHDCIKEHDFTIQSKNLNCKQKSVIEVTSLDQDSLTYLLFHENSLIQKNTSGVFTHLDDGMYTIQIESSVCRGMYPEPIEVIWKKCPEVELSPNGDGSNDALFFQAEGKIIIYTEDGKRVTRLKGPIKWHGDAHAELLPAGYYYADINNGAEFLSISIKR